MAGIGQSSLPQSDQSSVWNNQYNMGRTVNVDSVNISNKMLGMSEKRNIQRMGDENGMINQQMLHAAGSNRPQTGFQANLMGADTSSGNPIGTNSGMKQFSMNNPMSGGFTSRVGTMNYISTTSGNSAAINTNPNVPLDTQSLQQSSHQNSHLIMSSHRSSNNLLNSMYNGAPGSSNMPTPQSMKSISQRNVMMDSQIWDGPVGNFDSGDFPKLNQVKSGSNLSHMSSLTRQNQYQQSQSGMVNYQNVMKPGAGLPTGYETGLSVGHHHQNQVGPTQEFSIQQEDFPALPVAQNPSTTPSGGATSATQGSSTAASVITPSYDQQPIQQSQQRSSTSLITPETGKHSFAHTLSRQSDHHMSNEAYMMVTAHQQKMYPSQSLDSSTDYTLSPSYSQQTQGHHLSIMPTSNSMVQSNLIGSIGSHSSQPSILSSAAPGSGVGSGGGGIASSNNSSQPPTLLSKQHHHQQQQQQLQHYSQQTTHHQSQQHPNFQHQKKVMQLHESNYIANIPSDMVNDAFGLIGLIKLINVNSMYENLKSLAPGFDMIQELNPDLNNQKDIYPSYVTPLSSRPSGRPHDMDYPVPREYRIRHKIMDKLAEPLPERLTDETLFWIFYNMCGEECQLIAARQLMHRQWRFHKILKIWLIRDPKTQNDVANTLQERGTFITWDYEKLTRVSRMMTLYFKDLESFSGYTPSGKAIFPFAYKRPPTISSSGSGGGSTSNMIMMPPTQMLRQLQQPTSVSGLNLHNPSNTGISNNNNIPTMSSVINKPSQQPPQQNTTPNTTSQISTPSIHQVIGGGGGSIVSGASNTTTNSSSISNEASISGAGSTNVPRSINITAVQQQTQQSKNLSSASLSTVLNNPISSSTQ